MSKTAPTDCLVLKFEEFDVDLKKMDTNVYVFYDKNSSKFVLRGQRRCTPLHDSCTYSFDCEFANDLVDFLQYIICKDNKVNEILYNYDNFPSSSDQITFEFLKKNDHSDYEISGYNEVSFKRTRLLKSLRMLRNVFNYYN